VKFGTRDALLDRMSHQEQSAEATSALQNGQSSGITLCIPPIFTLKERAAVRTQDVLCVCLKIPTNTIEIISPFCNGYALLLVRGTD